MQTTKEILAAISRLSDTHSLKNAVASYQQTFADAAMRVYPTNKRAKLIQDKFFIPNDAAFKTDTFLQSASELSVQNHLMQTPRASNVAIERQVNPPKDVDVAYEVGATQVATEIKCAVEQQPSKESLVLKTAGRVPSHLKTFADLKGLIEGGPTGSKLELAKNKDNTMKDFLVSANQKYSPAAGIDDLNVLIVACGGGGNIQEWWHYLYGGEALFSADSFYPVSEYRLVDVVILSNLKYLHSDARDSHRWSLQDAFLLPCVNPHRRSSAVSDSIRNGLSVFNHHMERFAKYAPDPLSADTPDYVMEQVKVNHYIMRCLEESERLRYFPVKPNN